MSPPCLQQLKSCGDQLSFTYPSPYDPQPESTFKKPVSAHTVPAHQHPSTSQKLPPDHHHSGREAGPSHYPPAQSQQMSISVFPGVQYKPEVRHNPHPQSRLCQDFHWVPYPLGLLPFDSWFKLHHTSEHAKSHSYLCPACMAPRKLTPHARKLFLVAERLSREDSTTSFREKSLNEELNWAVNYELGILDPFVDDNRQELGGKHSQMNSFHPYANEFEMKLAFRYNFMIEDITETTWSLWIGTQLDLQAMLGDSENQISLKRPSLREDGLKILESKSKFARPKTPEVGTIDLVDSPPPSSKGKSPILPTPPSSLSTIYQQQIHKAKASLSTQNPKDRNDSMAVLNSPSRPPLLNTGRRIVSYRTLQDFYGLLDKIERTSYVGAMFLEAYAEKLSDDLCKACWLKRNVNLDFY